MSESNEMRRDKPKARLFSNPYFLSLFSSSSENDPTCIVAVKCKYYYLHQQSFAQKYRTESFFSRGKKMAHGGDFNFLVKDVKS